MTQEGVPVSHAAETTVRSSERQASVAMSADEFRRLGHDLVDAIATFLASVPSRPVTTGESPAALKTILDANRTLPATPTDAATVLRDAAALLTEHSLFNGHPRFFGYITAPPAPIGILGDFLASAINANVGAWRLAPMASEIEGQAVRWIAELLGYRPSCAGLFVSGGNMANIVGFLAARAAAGKAWNIRETGVSGPDARPLRVYASTETHTWLQKAVDLSGIGTDAIRWIATTEDLRLDESALRRAMAEDVAGNAIPMLVVGSAGSVSTGVVDPLFAISEVCREYGAWFHVDGAYGAPAAAVPGTPHDLQALSLADSVAVDPHKWLYAPLEAGCVLVRDADLLRDAFSYRPPYYHFDDGQGINYVELGPQNSRGFRALKVWLMLRHTGADGYRATIAEDIGLARRLHDAAGRHPELQAASCNLSITTFRYVPAELRPSLGDPRTEAYLNALNEAVLDRVQQSGEAFVSNAVVDGRYLLRACIVNFHTGPADVDALPEIVTKAGRALHTAADSYKSGA